MNWLYQKGTIVRTIFFLLLVVSGWEFISIWSRQIIFYPAVNILSGQVPDLGLPVFAQFTVTQTLSLPTTIRVQSVVVPMYIPDNALPIEVVLRRNGSEVSKWQLDVSHSGTVDVQLPLAKPILLDGNLEVFFDGQQIAYQDRLQAPRLFVESADANYPYGHYRIAGNDKAGDISLHLIAIKTNGENFKQVLSNAPLANLPKVGLWIVLGILILCLPFIIFRTSDTVSD